MLKLIDPLLTGELLAILADMGHGDDIVLADANFPAAALAKRLIALPCIPATDVLRAILTLLPIDDIAPRPAAVMDAPGDTPAIYGEFGALLHAAEKRAIAIEAVERFAFYDRARAAFAVVATGERRLFGNLILTKGVVRG